MFNGIQNNCSVCDHPPGEHKCCPQCQESANGVDEIASVFGFRAMTQEDKGKHLIPQAWCRNCRVDAAKDKKLKERILV